MNLYNIAVIKFQMQEELKRLDLQALSEEKVNNGMAYPETAKKYHLLSFRKNNITKFLRDNSYYQGLYYKLLTSLSSNNSEDTLSLIDKMRSIKIDIDLSKPLMPNNIKTPNKNNGICNGSCGEAFEPALLYEVYFPIFNSYLYFCNICYKKILEDNKIAKLIKDIDY